MTATLLELARLADFAYLPLEEGRVAAATLGFETRQFFNEGATQCYLWERDDEAVVAPRGTEFSRGKIVDIWSNSRFWNTKWDGPGKAHPGYLSQLKRIDYGLIACLNTIESSKPVTLDGHSMGGAIVTQFAAWITTIGWKAARLVTFGAPKSLNREGMASIVCPVTRVVNRYDFAPHWPPLPPYTHCPSEKLRVDSGGWPGPVSRHWPENYITAIKRSTHV